MRTLTRGDWTFHVRERPGGFVLEVPDCGGMADMVPRVPEQLEWTVLALAGLAGVRQVWATAWNVDADALPAVEARLLAAP